MKYSNFDIERVKKAADIRNHIPGVESYGRKYRAKCPECGADGKKGMEVTHNSRMDLAKCWKCGFTLKGAVDAEMYYTGADFITAVEKVATECGITLFTDEQKVANTINSKRSEIEDSFCLRQLRESGLTLEDVTAKVFSDNGRDKIYFPTFSKGSIDNFGNINPNDDEMLIHYFDLYGAPMKYAIRGRAGGLRNYVRVRWSVPNIHLGKDGKAMKYQSPKGSDARFYFPQRIRQAFADKEPIDTLIIQEGEKKAEKACKHGILSIGIQGIYNIGSKEAGLIQDLQYLAQTCQIKNIVLLFDADWNNLSSNLENGDTVDQRPNQFARAAIKFRTYVETLHKVGCFVDVWFGHLNDNGTGEKGIDDLLAGSLKGKESEFAEEIYATMKSHNGIGQHANFHKISIASDIQILDFWKLRNRDEFFELHAEKLKNLQHFKFAKVRYTRDDNGKIIPAMACASTEFWDVSFSDKGKKECNFKLRSALELLQSNGYYRVMSPEFGPTNFGLMRVDNSVASFVGEYALRDFVYQYALQNCKDPDILDMLAEKLGTLLGKSQIERLDCSTIEEFYEPEVQNKFYSNGQARITSYGIDFGPMAKAVWETNVIHRQFKRIPIIEEIEHKEDGTFDLVLTKEGMNCEFFTFLRNTSNFWKDKPMQAEDVTDHIRHIVNKITAIGYLLTDFKFPSEKKAVIAMDGKMSEIGASNGRSGKSMIGDALSRMLSQEVIDGKNLKSDDEYMYSTVTPRTRNIFIDDVKVNFNFEKLYQAICGPLAVNPKTMARFTIPFDKAPKFYITTNHALNDNSSSAEARKIMVSFSNWYNSDHTPIEEFGHAFFEEWDEYQWQLFDNFMLECIMYYLRSMREEWGQKGCGAVQPPMNAINARVQRQLMGEAFLQWAEAYYDKDSPNLNCRKKRVDLYEDFCKQFPGQRAFVTSAGFRKKLIHFCEFNSLAFNPHKPHKDTQQTFKEWKDASANSGVFEGDRDCANGVEYFTVGSDNFDEIIFDTPF